MGHNLYMENSSLELYDDLCIETVRPNRQLMPQSNGQKMKLKQNDTETKVGVT
jgi:hypothetical protein